MVYDPKPNPGVRIDSILVEDLWLVGSPQALPAGVDVMPLQELSRYPLVVPGASHSHRRLLEGVALSHGVRLDIRAEVDSLTVIKRMAAEAGMFSILAHGAVQAELAAGKLRAARLVEPSISRSVALASSFSRSDNQASHAIARLALEIARDAVAAGVWRGRADPGADARDR